MGTSIFCILGIGLITITAGKSIYSSTSGHTTLLFGKSFEFLVIQEQEGLWMVS